MNWDEIGANWDTFKGRVRSKWGKLTDDDLEVIKGKKDMFLGKIRERYGKDKDNAEKELDEWIRNLH